MTYVAPTFIDGLPYPASVWNTLAAAVEALSNSMVDAIAIATNPIASGAFATETDVEDIALSGPFVAGRPYMALGQYVHNQSTTTTETNMLLRWGTPLTGRLLGAVRLEALPSAGIGAQVTWAIPFIADATGNYSICYSLLRATGAGTTTVEGGSAAMSCVIGIGTGGLIRSV